MATSPPLVWPVTQADLVAAGYEVPEKFSPTKCGACDEHITFWKTPKGKMMPLQQSGDLFNPHWMSCPGANSFRKPYERKGPR